MQPSNHFFSKFSFILSNVFASVFKFNCHLYQMFYCLFWTVQIAWSYVSFKISLLRHLTLNGQLKQQVMHKAGQMIQQGEMCLSIPVIGMAKERTCTKVVEIVTTHAATPLKLFIRKNQSTITKLENMCQALDILPKYASIFHLLNNFQYFTETTKGQFLSSSHY